MALRAPRSLWKPLGPQTQPRMQAHDIICLHTMAGYLRSTYGYFAEGNGPGYGGTESHFGIGGKWGSDQSARLDGALWQFQDLAYSADANLEGNYRVISIETADNAVRPIQPWTPAQLDTIRFLIDWLCSREAHSDCPRSWNCYRYGIPRTLVPDSRPGRRGIAYHAQGSRDLVPGGERWSTTLSKDCPTDVRIRQLRSLLTQPTEKEPFTMAQYDDIMHALNMIWRGDDNAPGERETHPMNLTDIAAKLNAVSVDVKAIKARLDAMDDGEPVE